MDMDHKKSVKVGLRVGSQSVLEHPRVSSRIVLE
jgi:hypothetical protein